ncbi:MAG: DUF3352 domain-containing protein, partial [Chloroflexia bacterium]|nr:DUF3352 domain-containing protein [Chloroflexia bacterium]
MLKKLLAALVLMGLLVGMLGCGQPEAVKQGVPLARYMPGDTDMFLSLHLRPEGDALKNWQRVRDAFTRIPAVREELQRMQQEAELPFDWKADVDPWLGEYMSVGIIDLQSSLQAIPEEDYSDLEAAVESAPPPPILMAVQVRDTAALERFLDTMHASLAEEGITVQESTYKETTMYSFSQEDMDVFYALHDENVLLVASESALLEAALERQEPDSLAAKADFQNLLERLPGGGLALGYADYESLRQVMREGLSETQETELPSAWAAGVRTAGFSMLAEDEGLRLQAVANLDLAAMAESGFQDFYEGMRQTHAGRSLEFMPTETTLAFSGRDVKAFWDMQSAQMQQLD